MDKLSWRKCRSGFSLWASWWFQLGQQPVDQIGHQAGDGLGDVICQQPADGKGQQPADQLELPEIFGRIFWEQLL